MGSSARSCQFTADQELVKQQSCIQAIKSAKFRKLHCGNFTCFGSGQERGAGGVFGAGYVAAVQPNQPDGTSVVESVLEGKNPFVSMSHSEKNLASVS